MCLEMKNKDGFITGSIKQPYADNIYPYWKRCNTLVLRWIFSSVSADIAQSLFLVPTAQKIMSCRSFRICEIQENLYRLNPGDCTISKYYTSMRMLWDELDLLYPIP
jgi:hypothetical protein